VAGPHRPPGAALGWAIVTSVVVATTLVVLAVRDQGSSPPSYSPSPPARPTLDPDPG
jgi:hypothetical protein